MKMIIYGDQKIMFDVVARPRNNSRILIKVYPNGKVLVTTPFETTDEEILDAVKKRTRWIYRQQEQFKGQLAHVTPRRYVSGESHYYLGKQHLLKVIEDPFAKPRVKLFRGKLEVYVTTKDVTSIKRCLDAWYKSRAKDVFQRRLEAILSKTLWIATPPPTSCHSYEKTMGQLFT